MLLQTSNYKTFQVGNTQFTDFRQAMHCLPGDIVEWQESKCILKERATHRFIPGILETNSKVLYGHTSRGAKVFLFHPHDRKYPPFRVGSSCRDTSRNQLALIEFMDWDEIESLPRGSLLRMLGTCGDIKAELEALTYQYSSPKLAKQLFDISDVPLGNRIPLTGFTFNIDPDGCQDIDDVFTLKQLTETVWQFVITISDVAGHIVEGSDGDTHAYTLGQTLYQTSEAIVPMLPFALSELVLSLQPTKEHLGVSLFCEWNTETKELSLGEFKETVFTNNASFTYDTISKVTEIPLAILQEIASYLHGSVTTDSHEWVAECMILYNKQVALKLLEHKVGLLRIHKAADAKTLDQFTKIHPDLKALAYEAAKYEPTTVNQIHAGLGSVPYCHASSPIRRYADLVNQRHLKAILQGSPLLPTPTSVAEHLNRIQKRMRSYERSLFFLQQIVETPTGQVQGLVAFPTGETTKVYIPSWKHMIRVDGSYAIGEAITIDYYVDLQKPHWDTRIVFRVVTAASDALDHSQENTE